MTDKINLDEREAIALLRMLDHRPAGDEHRDLRETYYRAVQHVFGNFVWFGRERVYLTERWWHFVDKGADAGIWVAHEKGRALIGDYRTRRAVDIGALTIVSAHDFPSVVWVVSSRSEYDAIMQRPVVATPAEWSPKVDW